MNFTINLGEIDISTILSLFIGEYIYSDRLVSLQLHTFLRQEPTHFLMGLFLYFYCCEGVLSALLFFLLLLATFLKNLLPNHCASFTDTHKVNVLPPWTQTHGTLPNTQSQHNWLKMNGNFFKLKFNDTSGTWIHSPFLKNKTLQMVLQSLSATHCHPFLPPPQRYLL